MSLAPGMRLGPYEILESLGAGGMGEVYRAADPRLGRQVAIKVLPGEFSADLERLARFEQEARAAAALSHPNIAVVYDVGAEGPTHYLVQEYLTGASLRHRLITRPDRPLSEWLPIAADIASALAAAHHAGIVHRDIKPENVMVAADGRAKVLDFGLAKLTEPTGAGLADTNSPTVLGTMAGTVMGTIGYLAPEQAAGQPVDRRADIFALGCILYEMAAGERPFAGRSAAEVIAHVLHDEPRPLADVRPNLPAEFHRIVGKCLAKDPARRYQHADDLSVDLADLQRQPVAASSAPSGEAPARPPGPARWLWPVAVALAMGLAAWGWFRPHTEATLQPPSRLALLVPNQGGSNPALQRQIAITPDGRTLLFPATAADGQNRTMRMGLDDTEPSALPGVVPFLADYVMSPDGREFLGTVAQSRQLFRYSIAGGTLRPLPRDIVATPNAAWASDGSIWFGTGFVAAGLVRLSPDDTVSRPFGAEHGNLAPMQVLPGDRTALVLRVPTGSASGPAMLLDLETGSTTVLVDMDVVEIRYTPGYLVYALADGSLQAVAFDPRDRRVVGEAVRIASGISLTGAPTAQFAVAENGTVAYIPEEPRSLVLVGREGSIRQATAEKRNFHAPMFSPDGRRIATDFNSADGRDVWLLNLGDGLLSRATFDRDGHDATWTPDGASLTYTSVRDGLLTLLRARPGVSQAPEVLLASPQLGYSGLWLNDGTALVTVANSLEAGSGSDLAVITRAGAGPLEPLVATRFEEQFPAVSPDDRWVAFVSNQTGQDEVYVRALRGEGDQVQVSLAGGIEPVWSPDGREVFYRSGADAGSELVAASVRADPAFAVTSRRTLFPVADMATATPHRNYDISPDGTTFVMVRFNPSSRIVVIQNLPALVQKLSGAVQRTP